MAVKKNLLVDPIQGLAKTLEKHKMIFPTLLLSIIFQKKLISLIIIFFLYFFLKIFSL